MTRMNIEVKILDQRLLQWGIPQYQTPMAAGIDLIACVATPIEIFPQESAVLIPTGIAVHMNHPSMCAVILPRSGLGHKKGLILGNSVGLIDADYIQQCFISAWNRNSLTPGSNERKSIVINPGDRIAQMVFLPILRPEFTVVEEFTKDSERTGGFGSTGV